MIAKIRVKLRSLWRQFYDVPWCVPAWGRAEAASTIRALVTGTIVRGPAVDRFAAGVKTLLSKRFALPVNRGRTAIELGLRAMAIGLGDDVVIPSYVCRSVLEAVVNTGAHPVFADIDDTLNISRRTVEAALTPQTKCVIVVHLFGSPAPIDEIESLLNARGIPLMDDAAQALGARVGNRIVGSFGACGIVSCGPGKPLAGAAGGLLVTNDPQLYERAASLELAPESTRVAATRTVQFWVWRRFRRYTAAVELIRDRVFGTPAEEVHENGRLSNIDAGIALAQLEHLDEHTAERRVNAEILARRLQTLPGTVVTDLSSNGMVIKLVYVIAEEGPSVLDAVQTLAAHGIESQPGYRPVHDSADDGRRLTTTVALWSRVLCVPLETKPRSTAAIPFGRPRVSAPHLTLSAVDTPSA